MEDEIDDLPALRIVLGLGLRDGADDDAIATVRRQVEDDGGEVARQRSAVLVALFPDMERAVAAACNALALPSCRGTAERAALDLGDVIGSGANADGRPLERVADLATTRTAAGPRGPILLTAAAAPFARRSRRIMIDPATPPSGIVIAHAVESPA